jgi:hypothetical protein
MRHFVQRLPTPHHNPRSWLQTQQRPHACCLYMQHCYVLSRMHAAMPIASLGRVAAANRRKPDTILTSQTDFQRILQKTRGCLINSKRTAARERQHTLHAAPSAGKKSIIACIFITHAFRSHWQAHVLYVYHHVKQTPSWHQRRPTSLC